MTAKEAYMLSRKICLYVGIFPVNQNLGPALSIPPMYRIRKAPKMVEEQACMLTRYPMQHGSKMPMQITKSPKQDKKQDLYIYPKLTISPT